MTGPKPVALPLGYTPIPNLARMDYIKKKRFCPFLDERLNVSRRFLNFAAQGKIFFTMFTRASRHLTIFGKERKVQLNLNG